MKAKLVVVASNNAKSTEIPLVLPALVGRGREATLTVPHPLISRQHCEIFEADGQLIVRDLGSLNGTFVAGQRISECALPDGEILTVGTVSFRAVYEEARQAGELAAESSGDESAATLETELNQS